MILLLVATVLGRGTLAIGMITQADVASSEMYK